MCVRVCVCFGECEKEREREKEKERNRGRESRWECLSKRSVQERVCVRERERDTARKRQRGSEAESARETAAEKERERERATRNRLRRVSNEHTRVREIVRENVTEERQRGRMRLIKICALQFPIAKSSVWDTARTPMNFTETHAVALITWQTPFSPTGGRHSGRVLARPGPVCKNILGKFGAYLVTALLVVFTQPFKYGIPLLLETQRAGNSQASKKKNNSKFEQFEDASSST